MMEDHCKNIANGVVGTLSSALGLITSFQEQIEWHLRMASLTAGLAVAILSAIAIVRRWK